ncbi:MAG: Ig-like domain-containing protein [Dokdonella sp.]
MTFTAHVDGVFGPTGSVSFNAGATTICANVPLDAGSPPSASCTTVLPVGSHDITASYGGDIDDAASTSGVLSQTVAPMTSTTLLGTNCATTFVENQTFTMMAGVSGFSPTGSVTFSDGGNPLASVPLASGSAGFTVAGFGVTGGMPAETHALTAGYSGDGQNTSSLSGSLLLTVLSASESVFRNGFETTLPGCPAQ